MLIRGSVVRLAGWELFHQGGIVSCEEERITMDSGSALMQQQMYGLSGVCDVGCWKKGRVARVQRKVRLPRGQNLQCWSNRPMELSTSVSMKVRAVREGMVAESSVTEPRNGAHTVPAGLRIESTPTNSYIGYGYVDEENFYRERFVVRFSEVGDRGTMSLEMLASLLQVQLFIQKPSMADKINVFLKRNPDLTNCVQRGRLLFQYLCFLAFTTLCPCLLCSPGPFL